MQANAELVSERRLVEQLREDVARAQEQLQQAQAAAAVLEDQNSKLAASILAERDRSGMLSDSATSVERQLAEARRQVEEQRAALDQVGLCRVEAAAAGRGS